MTLTIEELMERTERALKLIEDREGKSGGRDMSRRSPSRFANEHASHEKVMELAGRGQADPHDPTGRKQLEPGERKGGLVLQMKALSEGTLGSGGYLVSPEYSDQIVTLIRARAAVSKMGATHQPVYKEMDVTGIATGATAYYVAENAVIPTSELTFNQRALLRPRSLAALCPVSNRLLRDSQQSPTAVAAADRIIEADISEVLALRQDLAFLNGTGTDPEPKGILQTSGLTAGPSLGANGASPTFDALKDTVAGLRAINAPFTNPGWVFHPRCLSTLEKIQITSGGSPTGEYLGSTPGMLQYDRQGAGGTLLGYSFATTTQLPTTTHVGTSTDTTTMIFSSDWQECWIGEEEGLTLEVSAEASYTPDSGATWISAFQSDQSLFRAIMRNDMALRRPELFTTLTGVRP